MRRILAVALLVAVLGIPASAVAGRRWQFAENWQQYSPGERYEALRNYERHREKPKENQREVERQYQRWQKMPKEEQERIRRNYERYKSMPPEERSRLQKQERKSNRNRDH
jgi:hypothetical protein